MGIQTEELNADRHGRPGLRTRIGRYVVETVHREENADMTTCHYHTSVRYRPEGVNSTDEACIDLQEMTGIFGELVDQPDLGPNAGILRQPWNHGCPVGSELIRSFHEVVAESVKLVLDRKPSDDVPLALDIANRMAGGDG